jgi:hypothetical protein
VLTVSAGADDELRPTSCEVEDDVQFKVDLSIVSTSSESFGDSVKVGEPPVVGGFPSVAVAHPKRRPVRLCQFAKVSAELRTNCEVKQ